MPEPAHPPGSDAGFFEHARELCSAGALYLSARLRLLGLESKDALVHYGIILALAAGAFGVILFGYLFFCIGLAFLLARLLHFHAEWAILIVALLHFVVAAVCLFIAKTKIVTPMFNATLAELKKDQEWLNNPPH